MRALSLWQPWASLVVARQKVFETRSWSTRYRGPLAIHAARKLPALAGSFEAEVVRLLGRPYAQLPLGCFLGVCQLEACIPTAELHPGPIEAQLGDFGFGRWAWALLDALPLPAPIAAKGAQRLFLPLPDDRAVLEAAWLAAHPEAIA